MDGVAGEPGRRRAGVDRLYSDFMGIIGGKKLEYVVRVGLGERQKKTREKREKKKREPHASTRSSLETILVSGAHFWSPMRGFSLGQVKALRDFSRDLWPGFVDPRVG
jgi:hypothetical protein